MRSRTDWLDAGLRVLGEQGLPGVRIEALSRRLAVTKGSFYHHFVDLADFRRALLGHYEDRCTARHVATNSALADRATPLQRLHSLADAVLAEEDEHRGLEVAVRAWAGQDDDARSTVERVDGARLGYLEELLGAVLPPAAAGDLARTIYYLLVGAQHVVPPGTSADLRRLYERLLTPLDAVTGVGSAR